MSRLFFVYYFLGEGEFWFYLENSGLYRTSSGPVREGGGLLGLGVYESFFLFSELFV
jgi:hypothetical protein